jgi:hypothetical protein
MTRTFINFIQINLICHCPTLYSTLYKLYFPENQKIFITASRSIMHHTYNFKNTQKRLYLLWPLWRQRNKIARREEIWSTLLFKLWRHSLQISGKYIKERIFLIHALRTALMMRLVIFLCCHFLQISEFESNIIITEWFLFSHHHQQQQQKFLLLLVCALNTSSTVWYKNFETKSHVFVILLPNTKLTKLLQQSSEIYSEEFWRRCDAFRRILL